MKNIILLLTLSLIITTCNSDDDNPPSDNTTTIVGTWKLTSIYLDPGDGSGTFEDVTSDRTITFNTDETYDSNGFLCDLSTSADVPVSGLYSNSTIDVSACSFIPLALDYSIENSHLIINYQCIETCQTLYEKL